MSQSTPQLGPHVRRRAGTFHAALVAAVLLLSTGVGAHAQRVADSWTIYDAGTHTFPIVDAQPGDYVKIQLTYSETGEAEGQYAQTVCEGHTLTANAKNKSQTVEFFANESKFNVVTTQYTDGDYDSRSTAHVTVWLGRPDIQVKTLTLANQTLTCTYSIGSVPWDPRTNYIPIALYYSSTLDASGIADLRAPIAMAGVKYGMGFRNQPAQVSFPCNKLPLEPYGKTNIVAVFDPGGLVPETSDSNNYIGMTWSFVEQVPYVESDMGWDIGAAFMRRWLQGSGTIATKNFSKDLASAELGVLKRDDKAIIYDDTSIKMDWVFSHSSNSNDRAAKAAAALVSNFYTAKSSPVLEKLVRNTFLQHPSRTQVTFGDFSLKGSALHAQEINFASVEYMYDGYLPLDPLEAALGGFIIYLIPHGTAQIDSKRHITGEITSVGLYVGDEFEFGGFQPLGAWHVNPSGVSQAPTLGFTWLWNSDFRDYRNRTGLGRDMVILSDVRVVNLGHTITFKF